MRKVVMIAAAVTALALAGFSAQSSPAADNNCDACCVTVTCCK